MQSLRNTSNGRQLGGTNWAFIITLIIALVFIWLWFQETDKIDKALADKKAAEEARDAMDAEANKLADALVEVSDAVGWKNKNFGLTAVTRAERSIAYSDAAAIKANFDPEGVVQGAEEGSTTDGILKKIIAAASLTFEREGRLHSTKTGEEKDYKFQTLNAAFKEKLASVQAKWADVQFSRPTGPADPDNDEGLAAYNSELAAWEEKVKEYSSDLAELSQMEGWNEYSQIIAAPGQWADITKTPVTVAFYSYAKGGARTIENAMTGLDKAFDRMGDELRANAQTWGQEITQLRKDTAAKEQSISELQTQLQTAQAAHNNDVEQLQGRLNAENDRANRNAVDATNARNETARVKEESAQTVAALSREVEARKEQNRLLKEKRDLVIARDDVDGEVLVGNPTLGTAIVNIGHKDKAYVGQKFVVSALDRAGNRVNKGEIMLVKVTGDHSAKARILAGSAGRGDRIHNPFYQPGETIYVYFAGKMDKWPMEMARDRLAKTNVIVQDAPNGKTHYIIVPNSWAAVVETTGEDDEEDDGEEDTGSASTPLEQAQKTARIFGANVITENLLDAFLNY